MTRCSAAPGRSLPPAQPGGGSVRPTRVNGVGVIDLDNGRFKVRVCPVRGMSILSATAGKTRVGWNSPAGEVVHPRDVDQDRGNGIGWLDGFTEMLVRCGLRNLGRPGWDQVRSGGRTRREWLTLHGKAANLPAQQVRTTRGPGGVAVSGTVRERAGDELLELRTTIALSRRGTAFEVTDDITNRGPAPAEFQLLYHANFGPPLLGAGSQFLAPIECFAAMNPAAARHSSGFDRYCGPTPGFEEEVFMFRPRADAAGRTCACLINPQGTAAVSVGFSVAELPWLALWKQSGAPAERYVTGLEPCTSFPNHRGVERALGRVPRLVPGETRRITLTVQLHRGKAAVTRLRRRVATIQGSTRPRLLSVDRFNARGLLPLAGR